jgi:hypothetical protein
MNEWLYIYIARTIRLLSLVPYILTVYSKRIQKGPDLNKSQQVRIYHVFKKSGRILDRGTTEMDQYAIELFER